MQLPDESRADAWGEAISGSLRLVAAGPPLVHCLTNIVVAGFTANVLLALGASPAMVENTEEAAPFAAIAGGVLVNLGTLNEQRATAMTLAAGSAQAAGVPWVLDPVAVGALEYRTRLATSLLDAGPAVVRGNGSEIQALAAAAGVVAPSGAAGRGVDSLATSEAALPAARALAEARSCVVAVSGATDHVTDGRRTVAITGGHPLMARVTGTGCALGSTMVALLGVGLGGLEAAAVASALFAIAGERAAVDRGPGSFAVAFLDELGALADASATR